MGLPSGLFPYRFPHQNPAYTSLLTHMRYMPSPSHSSRFCQPKNIGWGIQIIKQYRSLSSTDHWAVQIIEQYRSLSSTDH
jgi:hypothetical protein